MSAVTRMERNVIQDKNITTISLDSAALHSGNLFYGTCQPGHSQGDESNSSVSEANSPTYHSTLITQHYLHTEFIQ